MGYQVGNQCFESREAAENHYFSLVVPQIQNGQLIQPKKVGERWEMQGQVLQAQLPECDPAENFRNGTELGWLIFGVMAGMYTFHIIKGLFK